MRQYIGARYVTKIYENSQDPSTAEWEANVNYEPLTMVTYNNGSYISKKEVPGSVGNPAANTSYWVQTGFYNGQIADLQQNKQNKELETPIMIGGETQTTVEGALGALNSEDAGTQRTYEADPTMWDTEPTEDSDKPVTSGGLHSAFGNISDAINNKEDKPVELSSTLGIGATSLTFTDPAITADCKIDVYTDIFGVNPTNQLVSGNVLTLIFNAQATAVSVVVLVR